MQNVPVQIVLNIVHARLLDDRAETLQEIGLGDVDL